VTLAYGIDGDRIVGYYHDGSGYHGFVYVIPEPATLLLLGLGVPILFRIEKETLKSIGVLVFGE